MDTSSIIYNLATDVGSPSKYLRWGFQLLWILELKFSRPLPYGSFISVCKFYDLELLISNLRYYDLRGCLKAAMALEATMAVRGNMHIDTSIIKVADFKYEVI